jgi:hypothetical protein
LIRAATDRVVSATILRCSAVSVGTVAFCMVGLTETLLTISTTGALVPTYRFFIVPSTLITYIIKEGICPKKRAKGPSNFSAYRATNERAVPAEQAGTAEQSERTYVSP